MDINETLKQTAVALTALAALGTACASLLDAWRVLNYERKRARQNSRRRHKPSDGANQLALGQCNGEAKRKESVGQH